MSKKNPFDKLTSITQDVSSKASDIMSARKRKKRRLDEREYTKYTIDARNKKDNSKELGRTKKRK